jgi:AcrR family transcriptional regulator
MGQATTKSERTRQFIIEATADIFNKKGYAGTSLTDLTEATKLTKGSIYGNFASKEEVALAAFDYNWTQLNSRIKAKEQECPCYRDKLLVYAAIYKHVGMDTLSHGGCPVLNTATEADDTNPQLKEKAAAAFTSWKAHLVSLLRKGVDAGEFQAAIDPEQIALTMIALIEGSIMIMKLTHQSKYFTAIQQSLTSYIASFSLPQDCD